MIKTPWFEEHREVLKQGIDFLKQIAPEDYVRKGPLKQSIGAHYRHIIDHYHCFQKGVQEGRVDYDQRARDCEIETNLDLAKNLAGALYRDLSFLEGKDPHYVLNVRSNCGDDHEQWSRSSLLRECQFVSMHSVHHYALVAMIADSVGLSVPKHFGVAPSTVLYESSL